MSRSPTLGPPFPSVSTFVSAVTVIVVLIVVVVPPALGAASAKLAVAMTVTAAAAAAARIVVRIVSFLSSKPVSRATLRCRRDHSSHRHPRRGLQRGLDARRRPRPDSRVVPRLDRRRARERRPLDRPDL